MGLHLPLFATAVSARMMSGFRVPDGSVPDDTTRQRNTHIAVTGIVHYPWHPWRNRSVFVDDMIDRNGRVYFRCHVEETVHLRALEIPDWMLQETCSTTGLVEKPVVNCSALRNLKALLDGAPSSHDLGLKKLSASKEALMQQTQDRKPFQCRLFQPPIARPTFATMPRGSKAEDDRTHVGFATSTLGTAMRKPGEGGRP